MQVHFEEREAWRAWLKENHAELKEVWLVFYKKHTERATVSYDEAVEEALCFGWIDSIIKRLDEDRYAQKFTPRRERSKWSASNLARVERMIAAGRMTDAGLAKIPADVKAESSIASRPLSPPPFFAEALRQNPAAQRFFDSLAPSYRRNFIHWLSAAKREDTRERRLLEAISLLSQGKKLGIK